MSKFFNTRRPLGIQLWSLKDEMVTNPKKTIQSVADIGYKRIELFQGEKGILWGMKPKEFNQFLVNTELETTSAHCDPFNNFEHTVELAAEVGLEYLVCAWLGPNDSLDFYKKALEKFNYCAELCHQNGLKFAYHNHDYSLKPVEGVVPHKLFLEQTDPKKMFFEMDIYWVVVAEQDPLKWLFQYPDRWKMAHIKDLSAELIDGLPVSTQIGKGTINFKKLLPDFLKHGVTDFYVEQEYFALTKPVDAAEENFNYLINLKD